MTALVSGLAHLFALLRGWMDQARERAREHAIRTAEQDRNTAETQTTAREAEHAAQDEMAQPADRGAVAERLRQGGF